MIYESSPFIVQNAQFLHEIFLYISVLRIDLFTTSYSMSHTCVCIENVKFAVDQSVKAQEGSRGIALLFL